MKLTKYLILAGAALMLTACSSSEDWNTNGGTTVEMAAATMKVKENVGTFYVPLKLTGKTNGKVEVTVAVSEYAGSPAIEDVHYYLTQSTVVFPNDSANVSLEFVAVNDMEVNEDRIFTVEIVKVEGAQVGEVKATEITITDDDGLFYEAIQGAWKMTGTGFFDGSAKSADFTIRGFDDDDPNYERVLEFSGWGGASNLVAKVEYSFDLATNTIELYFPYDQTLGQLNFTGLGACDVVLFGVSGDYLVDEGGAYATVSEDLRTITFEEGTIFYFGVLQNGEYLGGWDGIEAPEMTR